ncbi:ribonuclease Y [Williamsoniiplasma lucivorax]|uniref:Ribonuclease Y n=1 Tax=Williamsoniiplasma lucivorax TaxID=209274 RepID=A0A2S5RD64_9MOLU|nr:ribonuclease Y [Williamsoniiplasma lucivorax]PPE05250.1 ribonuclease Y [Williamsoniiplasma lucivorax]
MTELIIIGLLLLVIVALIGWLLWMYLSQSRKKTIETIKKEAKQERKTIVATAYKDISGMKIAFQRERDQKIHEIELTKTRLATECEALEKDQEILKIRQERLNGYEIALEKRSKEYDHKISEVIDALESISGYSKEEAKQYLLQQVQQRSKQEVNTFLKNVELESHSKAKTIATAILVEAMEKSATNIVAEKTTNIVRLPNDDVKGRIIGKDGRNIKAFEQFGGVEIIIDETPEIVTVSSFNPVRREIATKTLEKLILDGRIQPSRIEQELINQAKEIEQIIEETGQKVVHELGILNIDMQLVKLIGKLKYRTSYGQSVLLHSLEVAKMAGVIAAELGLDVKDAIRAGLLHDIGKAVDFENEGSHTALGVERATLYGENEVVINAIAAHHEEVPKNSVIAVIVAIADTMSAARPGARNNTIDEFFKRMNTLEKEINKLPGVDKTYALQSGRQIRVIVDPNQIGDNDMANLIEEVKENVLSNVIIPGEITVTVIRETREIKIIK